MREDCARNIDFPRSDPIDLHLDVVASEMMRDVSAWQLVALGRLTGDDHDLATFGLAQKRHGIARRARRAAATVPAHEDTVEFQAGCLNVRYDQDGPAGFEQRRFEQKAYKRRLRRPRLCDDTQIEAARDLSQHAGRPGYRRVEHMGFARD